MSRPAGTAELVRERAAHFDIGAIARRIHLLRLRMEHGIDTGSLQLLAVRGKAARIGGIILIGPELHRIHEHRGNDHIAMLPGCPHERKMPFVQRPHRRYEPDCPPLPLDLSGIFLYFLYGIKLFHDFHPFSLPRSSSSSCSFSSFREK